MDYQQMHETSRHDNCCLVDIVGTIMSSSGRTVDSSVNEFLIGFRECADETLHYLAAVAETEREPEMVNLTAANLRRYLDDREQLIQSELQHGRFRSHFVGCQHHLSTAVHDFNSLTKEIDMFRSNTLRQHHQFRPDSSDDKDNNAAPSCRFDYCKSMRESSQINRSPDCQFCSYTGDVWGCHQNGERPSATFELSTSAFEVANLNTAADCSVWQLAQLARRDGRVKELLDELEQLIDDEQDSCSDPSDEL